VERLRTFWILTVAVAFVTGCSGERSAYKGGRADAEADISKGLLRIAYAQGEQFPPYFSEYDELLANKYKIRWRLYAPPMKTNLAQARARGYNEVSKVEIERRFGTNALSQTMAEAEKAHGGSRGGRGR